MLAKTPFVALLLVFALAFVMGCADNPTSPDVSGVALAPGAQGGGEITLEQATQIALAQVAGTVVDTEREMENSVDTYGIEIETDAGNVKEVKINANTGEVIKIEDDDDGKFLGIF